MAQPAQEKAVQNGIDCAYPIESSAFAPQFGLTKREYFAAMALQGYIASYAVDGAASPKPGHAAEWAVKYTDALLLELAR